MSEAVSVMNGARFDGAVTVTEAGLTGMITLRGDLGGKALAGAVDAALGLALPEPRKITQGDKGAVAWMSPDELMIFCAYDSAPRLAAELEASLAGEHALVVDVSDARAKFTLRGAGVREVIAKGSPADLSPAALPVGEIRRSRLAQVAAGFWLDDAETLHLICFRSVGEHVWHWLVNAAAPNTLPGVLESG